MLHIFKLVSSTRVRGRIADLAAARELPDPDSYDEVPELSESSLSDSSELVISSELELSASSEATPLDIFHSPEQVATTEPQECNAVLPTADL